MFIDNLRRVCKAKGTSATAVLRALGMSTSNVTSWKKGVEPSIGAVDRIAEHLGVDVSVLLGGDRRAKELAEAYSEGWVSGFESEWVNLDKREDDVSMSNRTVVYGVKVPVLGDVRAGIPCEAVENVLDYEEITPQMARQGEFFALRIKGDSMEPRILEGDVMVVRKQETAETGNIVVALVNGQEATIKRIKKMPAGIMLIPNNPAYEPMFYSKEDIERLPVTIIGKVVELRGKL